MKKYRKNNTEVEAAQYDGSEESFNQILEVIEEDKRNRFSRTEGERGIPHFTVACKSKMVFVFSTEWIVKDGKYYFVVSNDIFQDYFTEIE